MYTTLERLLGSGLIRQDRDTEDGLPRYVLTDSGQASAEQWLRVPAIDAASPWESMRFQVLLALSLPGVQSEELVRGYRVFWQNRTASPGGSLNSAAREILAAAALEWLDRVSASSDVGEPMQLTRPPRGRPAGPGPR